MHLGELHKRFDDLVAAIASRVRDGGQDPNAVVDANGPQFKIKLMTVPQDPPLYYAGSFREVLQTSTPIERIADEFVAKWRDQRKADESIG